MSNIDIKNIFAGGMLEEALKSGEITYSEFSKLYEEYTAERKRIKAIRENLVQNP